MILKHIYDFACYFYAISHIEGGEWYSDYDDGARTIGGGRPIHYINPIVMVRSATFAVQSNQLFELHRVNRHHTIRINCYANCFKKT